nr:MAG TPA: hypothetical protein [Caudoviricetes sp.]
MNSCESIGFKVLLKLYEDTQRQKARYFYIVRMWRLRCCYKGKICRNP